MPRKRIGRLLIQRGVLSQDQLEAILTRQAETGEPFGTVALELYGVNEDEVWRACGQQMAAFLPHVELACEPNEPAALGALSAEEAWALCVLPLRYEKDGLVIAATAARLPEAMSRFGDEAPFVIAERHQIETFIQRRYHYQPPESTPPAESGEPTESDASAESDTSAESDASAASVKIVRKA